MVYSSGRDSLLTKLDRIHSAGLRYCLGAFPTSPVLSLHCESGIPPLRCRRDQLSLAYLLRVKMNDKHPNRGFLFPKINTYQDRPTITRPLKIRMLERRQILNVEFPSSTAIGKADSETEKSIRTHFKNHVKERILHEWQRIWDMQTTQLRRVKGDVGFKYEIMGNNREEMVKSHRVRIGHTALTHKHLLIGEQAPICERCNTQLSMQHIVCECPKFLMERQIHSIHPVLEENLKEKLKLMNTLEFLKSINVYKDL